MIPRMSAITPTDTTKRIVFSRKEPATQKAIAQLYATGSMKKIVAKWGMAKAVVLLMK